MKHTLGNLSKYNVETKDGAKGKIKDFLFDDESWIVRYLEADFGNLFTYRRILIPVPLLGEPDWESKVFNVKLSEDEIDSCPHLEDKATVSREYEKELSKYYAINYYWLSGYTMTGSPGLLFPPRPLRVPVKEEGEDEIDTNLRSYNEVRGYQINAADGKLGLVKEIIIDEDDFQIVYAVVDTTAWLPWSKKVLIPVNWLDRISYLDREVTINLKTDTIKDAPEYEGVVSLNAEEENIHYDFYRNTNKE